MKKVLALVVAAVMAFSLAACGGSSQPAATTAAATTAAATQAAASSDAVVIQCGMTSSEDGPYAAGVFHLNELLKESTGGSLQFKVMADSLLGGERDLFEGCGMGTVQSGVITTAILGNFLPDWYMFDLPFLFDTPEQVYGILDGEVGKALADDMLAKQNVRLLGMWECGFRECTTGNKAIVHPDDLKGLKIRTMENSIQMAAYSALGATPTPMAAGEVYTALQQGTMDGQEMPWLMVESHKTYEVQKEFCKLKYCYSPAVLLMAEDVYQGLSQEHKDALEKAVAETTTWQRAYVNDRESKFLDEMAKTGHNVTEIDMEEFREKCPPVWDEFIPTLNQDLTKKMFDQLGIEWKW